MLDHSIHISLRGVKKESGIDQYKKDIKTVTKFRKICNISGLNRKRVILNLIEEFNESEERKGILKSMDSGVI